MQILIELFGFTTLRNSMWNMVAYAAFIGIIVGVSSERYRNMLFTLGAGTLALYANFLHNNLFMILQILIADAAFLRWVKVPKPITTAIMIITTIAAYLFLISSGGIHDKWTFIGSLGLLGIAFGLILLPKHYGFLVMAAGGTLLVLYAFTIAAWVFFLLNIFFTIANFHTWSKRSAVIIVNGKTDLV